MGQRPQIFISETLWLSLLKCLATDRLASLPKFWCYSASVYTHRAGWKICLTLVGFEPATFGTLVQGYLSTNWPPVNGGQNSILNWVFKLNLSPNKEKKQQQIIFTCFSFWNSEKQGYLSWFSFQIKRHVYVNYKATSSVYFVSCAHHA